MPSHMKVSKHSGALNAKKITVLNVYLWNIKANHVRNLREARQILRRTNNWKSLPKQ